MLTASETWEEIHNRFLLPETFVEIDCAVTETDVQEAATASGTDEAPFSNVSNILTPSESTGIAKYATLEHNLWTLDGSRSVLPDAGPYESNGYVSDVEQSGSVTLSLSEVHTVLLPGITINWCEEYGEYPHVFTVTAYNGSTAVAETTITDNDSPVSLVNLDINNYDSVKVTVHNWCLPYRRARIEYVYLGHILTFTKDDIISYTHTQHGDLLTGELPNYSIEFTVNNIDGRWNPSNPTGLEKYLSERQKLTVRYGMDIGGSVEWIKAGTFYLSEWSAPSNGLEARFVARDLFEFLISVNMGSYVYGSLEFLASWATDYLLPSEATIEIDSSLDNYTAQHEEVETAAEIVQKCANAACCILRCDRDGGLHIEPFQLVDSGYQIPLALSYSHPEVVLSKPLKKVAVDYGADEPYELEVSDSGETQTVSNPYVTDEAQAALVATWVRDILQSRKTVSGEFRADPRLDLFDVVTVESKFGVFSPVVLTEIQYTFTGVFRASYTGRVVE